jgi:CheY-like chemotaxis protein
MVRQSGGHVWVYSEPGFGSTFKVYLPAKTTQPRSGFEQTAAPQGDFTVLLVDDSDPTRQVMKRCLQRDGYNLLEAHDGEQAVTLSEGFPGTIELAICDITMPGMTGPDAARLLRRQRPRIKILFTSGQGGEFCELPDPAEFPHSFVEKPVVPTALLGRVRTILAGI